MRAQDVKTGVVIPFMRQNPDVMAYVKLGSKYLDARKSRALPSRGRAPNIVFAGKYNGTLYESLAVAPA